MEEQRIKCWCHTCRPIDYVKDPLSVYMRLCPSCGNKRCPKATDHRNECTNSNEPNQIGSIYGVMVDSLEE
jgi:Zn finger protein HypA/HybF involved in hydrogenase expression